MARLRTYDAACEELGGAPWRPEPEATDRWFLPDRPKSQTGPSPTIDTGAFLLKKPLSDAAKLAFLGSAVLLVIVVVAVALGRGTPAHVPAAAIVPPPAPARPVATVAAAVRPNATPAPVVTRPPAAPPRVAPPRTRAPARRRIGARPRRR
jgi:hypothetical protein